MKLATCCLHQHYPSLCIHVSTSRGISSSASLEFLVPIRHNRYHEVRRLPLAHRWLGWELAYYISYMLLSLSITKLCPQSL